SGQNTVTILTAENEWSDDLTCPNVIVGNNPSPYAKAKWGVVQYRYFSDAAGTNAVLTDANGIYQFQADTYYYVRAYVPAMVGETDGVKSVNNYDEITTSYLIRFRAYKTSVFSTTGKTFVQLTNKDDVKMPANGALSVYFVTNQANNMKLTFDKTLYAKTKITMIIFGDTEQNATFYYYIVQQDNVVNEILLTSFVMMGGTENYAPPQSGVVKAQFAIDVPDDKSMTYFTVALEDYNNSTDLQAPVTILGARDESLSVDENAVTDEIAVPVSVSATGVVQGEDYVALAVTVDGTLPAEKQVYIVREDTGAISTPVYATNNYFVFSLGNADMNAQRYVVYVKNLADGGSYSITTDVRVVTTNTVYEHCLAGKDANNSKTVTNLVYKKPVEISVTQMSSPIVKQGQQQQLSFVITSNKASDYLISATLYEKTPNGFFESAFGFGNQPAAGFGLTLNVPEKTTQCRNQVTITVPDNMPAGVYRVVFELEGATCQTELIVS
ncbi:MAG: hypothetical protein IJV77_02740, partial [Clostridia bacterium]|nr:hypothetical protein [Clostridia bacterium]